MQYIKNMETVEKSDIKLSIKRLLAINTLLRTLPLLSLSGCLINFANPKDGLALLGIYTLFALIYCLVLIFFRIIMRDSDFRYFGENFCKASYDQLKMPSIGNVVKSYDISEFADITNQIRAMIYTLCAYINGFILNNEEFLLSMLIIFTVELTIERKIFREMRKGTY